MTRTPWFDEHTGELSFQTISRANSWQVAVADGVVTREELQAQSQSVARLLRAVDERVDDEVHGLLTEALRELSVLYAMQVFYAVDQAS